MVMADWTEMVFEKRDAVKINDGQSVELEFLDEGNPQNTKDGIKILFLVQQNDIKKNLWVNPRAGLGGDLAKIKKERNSLIGLKAKITRAGEKKATRYTLEKLN